MPEAESSFESALLRRDVGVAVDFGNESDRLIVAFGGMAGKLHMPPFEFFNLLKHVACRKIFLRDVRRCWYHRGLPETGPTLDSVVDHVGGLIRESGAQRVIGVGTSAGGYAATLFGCLLGFDEVLTFSPKTFINPIRRTLMRDVGSTRERLRLALTARARRRYFDLRRVLTRSRSIEVRVHFGERYPTAVRHARHLEGLPGVTLIPHDFDGHKLARHLRDAGQLAPLLVSALEAPGLREVVSR